MIPAAIASIFGGVVKPILDKFLPDAQARLEAEQMFFRSAVAMDMAQVEVNKVEASHSSIFVSGWRPALGWICALSVGYAVVGYTFFNWFFQIITLATGHSLPLLPAPDTSITMELVMGMLGLAGMRTYDKLKGLTK